MSPEIASGIVTGDSAVSYWSIPNSFPLSLVTIPEVLVKVNSPQFLSPVSIVVSCGRTPSVASLLLPSLTDDRWIILKGHFSMLPGGKIL